jgi:NAD(P) transhydrogenase subunit alpha
MIVSVPKESGGGERRVALVPEVVQRLGRAGVEVTLEPGAGASAHQPDAAYERAGATLGDGWSGQVVAKVAPPSVEEIGKLGRGSVLMGFLAPLTAADTVKGLAEAGVTSFAMEAIPRITRAQSMDALSSQATVGGYRAGLIAAQELPRFFPMLTTAAGTVRPAKVLVLGAGVAGLQAIATTRRLGAIVTAFDVRSVVKEQIESLGARFLELEMGLGDAEAAGVMRVS